MIFSCISLDKYADARIIGLYIYAYGTHKSKEEYYGMDGLY